MEANVANDGLGSAIHGYSRAEVDDFLNAAAIERARLEAEISDARGRIGRARSAIGMHRVMVAMLLETQRELSELRQQAEAHAEQIIIDAEAEAAVVLAGGKTASSTPAAIPVTPDAEIDLGRAEAQGGLRPDLGAASLAPDGASGGLAGSGSTNGSATNGSGGHDEYFDFLRGALADESPLGPGPE